MKTKTLFLAFFSLVLLSFFLIQYGCKKEDKHNPIGGEPCPGTPTVIDAGGNVYNTVLIGDQCWMKENLKLGTTIHSFEVMQDNGTIERYCLNDEEAKCEEYGGLYKWNEMMQYTTQEGVQGICPEGWHLPSDDEWCTLTTYIDSTVYCYTVGASGTNIGYKMKSTSGWYSNRNGSDAYGFKALPCWLYFPGEITYFWSSSEHISNRVWYRNIDISDFIRRGYASKDNSFSVRCVKD